MAASTTTVDFLAKLLAVEEAWGMLDRVEQSDDRVGLIGRAVAKGGHATQVLIRAGEMLAALGQGDRALRTLEQGTTLDGPTAPLQVALAQRLRAMGDLDGAARWLRGAMLRARPDARLLATLATVELESGRPDCSEAILAAAVRFRTNDSAGLASEGRRLRDLGRPDLAIIPFVLAYDGGYRDDGFVTDFGDLLADETMPVIDAAVQLGAGARAAHLKLSAHYRGEATVAAARAREASAAWVTSEQMPDLLAAAIARRQPFSWIRLGEGEARFLLLDHPELRGPLSDRETSFVIRLIWRNWFGQDVDGVDPARLAALSARLDAAVGNADLLGLTTAARFAAEPEHFGSLAVLERHIARIAPPGRPSDAFASLILNERDPFFASLLSGLDFLGVVGPHPELATRLADRLGIARTVSHVVPGESRLGRARDAADRGTHFPEVFDRIMAEIVVPRPGAVFLVAGGLLGKLYCDRIKQHGGIALDIGAAADAWMGFNTRGVVLDVSMRNRLVP